jgi:hypothetical protein
MSVEGTVILLANVVYSARREITPLFPLRGDVIVKTKGLSKGVLATAIVIMPFGAAISMLGVIEADNVKSQMLHLAG